MSVHRPTKPIPIRFIPLLLLLPVLLMVWACGQPAAPAAETAAPAAATEAPAAAAPAATAMPQPTAMPAMAESEAMLHLAITPLPQDTYLPWLASQSGHLVFRPMWESLTTIDPKTGVAEIYPQLATDWEISADATEYTFNLRQGVRFHFDWGEFTVKDFIMTIDQQVSEQIPGCRGPMRAFMGAESMTEMIDMGNMTVIDDHTFTMKLARPQVDIASWWFSILSVSCNDVRSSAQFKAEGEAMFETGPAGTGAYQFVSRDLREFAEYEAVPYDHWRVNPDFKRLRITSAPEDLTRLAMLLTGEANMVDVPKVLHQQAIDAGMEIFESPLPTVGMTIIPNGQYYVSQVNWHPDTEPWAAPGETGVLVREAMNRAINRDQIINELFKGRGEPMYNTIFHHTLEGWNPRWEEEFEEKYGYDPERARELLDQAGFPGDNGQNRFYVEVWQSSLPGLPETIEVSQTVTQAFRDIGIDAKLVEVEFARVIDAVRDRHDAHFMIPLRQTIRPINANTRIYYYTGEINPELGHPDRGSIYMEHQLYDDTYHRLLEETNLDVRHELAQKMGDHIYDNYRSIPIVNIRSTLVANPEEVAEYIFGSLTGVFGHLEYAKAAR